MNAPFGLMRKLIVEMPQVPAHIKRTVKHGNVRVQEVQEPDKPNGVETYFCKFLLCLSNKYISNTSTLL